MKKLRNLLAILFVLFGMAANLFAQEIKRIDEDFETLYDLCGEKKPDIAKIKNLLESGVQLNKSSEYSFTPLTNALYNKNPEIAKLLIEYGADVNLKDNNEYFPLNLACQIGDLSLVKLMVSKGADVNCASKQKYSPLIYAVESSSKDSLALVKFLVEKGANVNAATESGWTALIVAGWERNGLELIKYLVSKKADINAKTKDGYNVGMSSTRLIELECFKFLDENGFDFKACDKDGLTVLHYFIQTVTCSDRDYILYYSPVMEKEKEIAEIVAFLAKKIDINAVDNSKETVLHYAAQSILDYTAIIEILIKNGANVNALDKYDCTPITFTYDTPKIVQLFVDSGADLSIKDKWGKTVLDRREEALKKNPKIADVVEILKANSKNKKKYTFVQLCEYNYGDQAFEMLKKGKVKGLDDYDANGCTPLYYAVINNNRELTKALLDKGCDINKRNGKDETTVLNHAVDNQELEMVRLLLSYKPDLTFKYKSSVYSSEADILYTSIHAKKYHATYNEKKACEIIKCLLEAGCDPNAVIEGCSDSNYTITVDCCESGLETFAEILIEHGGNPFTVWTSSVPQLHDWRSFSIIRNDLQGNKIDYEERQAVYRGLVKQFKNKTLVATDNLRLRNGCSLSGRTITAIKKGTKVKVLEADNMEVIDGIDSCWVKVEVLPGSVDSEGKKLASGTTGWCFLGYLE